MVAVNWGFGEVLWFRRATGDARSLPDPPEVFSDGIPAAIVV